MITSKKVFIVMIVFSFCFMPYCLPKSEKQKLAEKLETEIPRLMKEANIPGLTIAVIRDGELFWSGAFGMKSTETGEPVDEDTMFEAASISKPVVAYAVLRMVDRGELDLDKPLAEYYPYSKLAGDERYKKITARLVMTHTTGLPNWGNRLIREPGKMYGYSGEGFLYLGRTAEKLTGLTLQEFVKREVFDPLGMTKSSFVWNDDYAANGACGHDRHGKANVKRKNTRGNAGASLLTTGRDFGRFLCAVLKGEGLKPETHKMMLARQVQAVKRGTEELDEHIFWGLGWGVMPGNGDDAFWHWGNNGDLRGYTVAYPATGTGMVYFANSENCHSIAEELISMILDDHQHALDWLKIKPYDAPERVAMMTIESTFIDEGPEAGMQKLQEWRSRSPEIVNKDMMDDIAGYLDRSGKKLEAIEVLKVNIEAFPESISAQRGLGVIYLDVGEGKKALEIFEKILEKEPDNTFVKGCIPWTREMIQAEENPVSLSDEILQKYAGDYGPRHVTFREGNLYYQRDGNDEFLLIPLNDNTFMLKNYGRFRLSFVADEDGRIEKIVGLYIEGRTDESIRDE